LNRISLPFDRRVAWKVCPLFFQWLKYFCKFNIQFALVGESIAYANVKPYLVDSDWMKRIFSTRTNDIGCNKFGIHVWLLKSISDECLDVSILTAKYSSWVDSRKSQKEDLVHTKCTKVQFIRHPIKFFMIISFTTDTEFKLSLSQFISMYTVGLIH